MKYIILFILSFSLLFATEDKESYLQNSYDFEEIKKIDSAIKQMHKLEKQEPENSFYKLRLGWLYYSNLDYVNSEKYYKLSYEIDQPLEAIEGQLSCAYAMQSYDNVIALSTEILKKYPKNFNALTYKAYAFYVKRQYDLAANFYRKATAIYPYHITTLGYLLSSEIKSGNKQNATITYKKLKKIYPQSPAIAEYEK